MSGLTILAAHWPTTASWRRPTHFVERQWIDADYFYGLLRSEYPDSDFLLQAHLLGLQAKLRAYQGPGYEGGVLDEAEILADQTFVQFPDQLDSEEQERIVKARAEIARNRLYDTGIGLSSTPKESTTHRRESTTL